MAGQEKSNKIDVGFVTRTILLVLDTPENKYQDDDTILNLSSG